MAFQQHPQQRPQVHRQVSITKAEAQAPASPIRKRALEESQEWILFSPQIADDQSHTSQTPWTATDFGSLETHVRSQPRAGSVEEATCQGTELDDDNAELDSLDDGLHAFHHHPFSSSSNHLDQSGGTVLPTHDGLGTFPSIAGLQEQLWQFERHNPHRKRYGRRRSSIQRRLDEVEEAEEVDVLDERAARIEKWRLEQSKAVLEEIEREARRRQRRMSRMSGASNSVDLRAELREDAQRSDSVIMEEPESAQSVQQPEQPSETWWQRLTRRVIQDLIGLDESTLSVIFGEELAADPSPTPTAPSPLAAAAQRESRVTFQDPTYSWELKLLDRIAKELGVLVHQLTEQEHAGAFSTYIRDQAESEYAGMPIHQPTQERHPSLRQRKRRSSDQAGRASSDALFTPTLPQVPVSPFEEADTSLWGIEEEPSTRSPNDETANHEREYWERDVDVNMLFTYLKRRFSPTTPPTPQPTTNAPLLPANWATPTASASALGTSPESLRRAEIIRRQHPLVSRAAEQSRRRESLLKRHQMQQLLQKRAGGGSSCASQSTKRSRRSKSGSSRHYWLEGSGSLGSGAAMSSGGLGGWGEV